MLDVQWLETVHYNSAWEKQKILRDHVLHGGPSTVLGCEHFSVLTKGKRTQKKDEASTFDTHIPLVHTDRGGLTTLHNPGQLVIYPIVNLRAHKLGVREWVELLLESTVACLNKCNIIVIDKKFGVFTKNGKIASIGININKGISTHGIAINVCNDLTLFDRFNPCGVQNQKMDKVAHYAPATSTEILFQFWIEDFRQRLTLLN